MCCQQLYNVKDKSRMNNQKVYNMGCTDCTTDIDESECSVKNYLSNRLINKSTIVDCSNKVLVTGANNDISDIVLKSKCNTGLPITVNENTSLDTNYKLPSKLDNKYVMIGGGVLVIIIILIFLFK